jgi:hypothetical protein
MISPPDCSLREDESCFQNYEPDAEDFAWMVAQEREVTSLRSDYHETDNELRNYRGHTDRQLRGLSKEKKRIKRHLARAHNFDVKDDSFTVFGDDLDVIDTVPYAGSIGPEDDCRGPDPLTRKGKRRVKKEQRRAARYLRIWRTQWETSRAASVVRKTGALPPVVAGMCHA